MRNFLLIAGLWSIIFVLSCTSESQQNNNNSSQTTPTQPSSSEQPQPTSSNKSVGEEVTKKGMAIAQKMQQALSTTLIKTMQSKGVSGAIQYCSHKALPLTDSLSKAEGVSIHRLASRNRNPENAISAEEATTMELFETRIENGQANTPMIKIKQDVISFYSPILIQNPLCLKCHGKPNTQIAAADLKTIQSLYPDDKATGFSLGDLRGMWRIDFPKKDLLP